MLDKSLCLYSVLTFEVSFLKTQRTHAEVFIFPKLSPHYPHVKHDKDALKSVSICIDCFSNFNILIFSMYQISEVEKLIPQSYT